MLNGITPFFIIDNLGDTLAFYTAKLGFQVVSKGGGEGTGADYWAMVRRDSAVLFLKAITPEIHPQPNHRRHPWARWDAYINASDPDALYREYVSAGATMYRELANTADGLRAFELLDNNGYVLCFGRPLNADEPAGDAMSAPPDNQPVDPGDAKVT